MGTIVSKSDPDAALGVAVDAAQDEDRAAVAGKRSSRFSLFEIVSKKRDTESTVAMEKLRDCGDSDGWFISSLWWLVLPSWSLLDNTSLASSTLSFIV